MAILIKRIFFQLYIKEVQIKMLGSRCGDLPTAVKHDRNSSDAV